MVFPQTPMPIYGELYVGSLGWVDITPDVRAERAASGGGITIERAQFGNTSQIVPAPGRCDFVLNNRDGKYSPRNPRSPYFGLIGRNTPVRFGREFISDSFNRSSAFGWSNADTGQTWLNDNPLNATVSVAKAHFQLEGDNTVEFALLDGSDCVDSDQVIDVSMNAVATGASVVTGFVARYQDALNYYWLRAEFDPSGRITAKISKRFGPDIPIAEQVGIDGVTYSANTVLRVRGSVVGTRLAMKIWLASQPEPRDWTISVSDSDIRGPGRLGLRSWRVAGNTNSPVPILSYDNYKARIPHFYGEISSWPAKWDTSGKDKWVPVEASGVLRRLNQGQKALRSPIYRNLSRYSPKAYWPLEDGSDATLPASAVPTPTLASASEVSFGSDDSLPGAATSARLSSAASSLVLRGDPTRTNAWSVLLYFKLDALPASDTTLLRMSSSGTVVEWIFNVGATGFNWIGKDSNGSTVFSGASLFGTGATPTGWVAMRIEAIQNGGNVNVQARWHGVASDLFWRLSASPIVYAGSVGSVSTIRIEPASLAPVSVGHVAVFDYDFAFATHEFAISSDGYVGERAGERILRLGREEGIPVGVAGATADTELCGRQGVDTFLNLLAAAAAVDGGILDEAKNDLAVEYRTRTSLYNQTSAVTISYADKQISAPFEPVEDDAAIRNDVTVTRQGGSSARFALESGPLSVQGPPNGVGIYDEAVTLNLADDDQPYNHAAWRVRLGTADEARYPKVRINLASGAWSSDQLLTMKAAAVDAGDVVQIDDLPDWLPPGPVRLLVQGYKEVLDNKKWEITWNATPASVWDVAVSDGEPRVDAEDSTLATALAATATIPTTWTFSSGVEGWTGLNGSVAHDGSGAVVFTPNGIASSTELRSPNTPGVTPESTWRATVRAKCAVSRNVSAIIIWRNSSGGLLSTSSAVYPVVADTITPLTVTGIAPADAAIAMVSLAMGGSIPSSNVLTVYEAELVGLDTAQVAYGPTDGPWTTDAAEFPLDILVGGEQMTVSAIAPALSDTFTRSVSGGWGMSNSGQQWTASPAGQFTASGSEGVIGVNATGTQFSATIPNIGADLDVTVLVRSGPVAAGGFYDQRIRYRVSGGGYVESVVRYHTTGQIDFVMQTNSAVLSGVASVLPYGASNQFAVRVQATGSVVQHKIWPAASPEPDAWTATVTTVPVLGSSSDSFALIGFRDAANTQTGLAVSFDSVTMRNPQRFTVARGVNGIVKSHPAGTAVNVANPAYLAL